MIRSCLFRVVCFVFCVDCWGVFRISRLFVGSVYVFYMEVYVYRFVRVYVFEGRGFFVRVN